MNITKPVRYSSTVSTKLTTEIHDRLCAIAKDTEISISDLVRQILTDAVENQFPDVEPEANFSQIETYLYIK